MLSRQISPAGPTWHAPLAQLLRCAVMVAVLAGPLGACSSLSSLFGGAEEVAPDEPFLIGSAYYEQIPDVTRDQSRTEKAIAALEEVSRKYPDSEYAQNAKRKIEVARDQLAGKEMDTGRYYLKRKDFTGAINRFKIVVTQYQTTRHVEEALMRLSEAYLSLGVASEAQTAAAVLGHNFPDSPWYSDAYRLVRAGGLEPTENKGSWISRAFTNPFGSTASSKS